jgi:hypothetical protein
MQTETWIAGKGRNLAKNIFAVNLAGTSGLTTPVFEGWSTSPDSSTVSFKDGKQVTFARDAKLYAVWGTKAENQTALFTAFKTLNDLSSNAGGLLVNYTINLDIASAPGHQFVVPPGGITLSVGTLTTQASDDNWNFPDIKAAKITITSTGVLKPGKTAGSTTADDDTRVLMPESDDISFWRTPRSCPVSYDSAGIVTATGFGGQDGIVFDKNGNVRLCTHDDTGTAFSIDGSGGAFEIDTASSLSSFTFSSGYSVDSSVIANIRVYGSTAWTSKSVSGSTVSLPVATGQKVRAIFIKNSNLLNSGALQNLFNGNTDIAALKGDVSNLAGKPLNGPMTISMQNFASQCRSLRSIEHLVCGSVTSGDSSVFNNAFSQNLHLTGSSAKVWDSTHQQLRPLYEIGNASVGGDAYMSSLGLSDWAAIQAAGWD